MSLRALGLPTFLSCAALLVAADARATVPGCTAAGPINSAFPSRLLFGIASQSADDTWAQMSGTKWDIQWAYLSGQAGNNWYNGFTYSPADGSWIDGFFSTISGYGFIPGIHLYNMGYGHSNGDSGILTEVQTASWTKEYFTEFKALMQRAKAFGKPVILMLEGDSFGYLEILSSNNPNAMAAVASTNMPELAGLPNTLAGFGMAFLAIRKSVGAYNVAMGPDTPYYAANGDIMNYAPSDMDALQPHVDYQWKFFGTFVGQNMTGDRFDFSASSPDANDCAAYTDGHPCWDPSDTASVNSASVNRYVQWLQLYNQTSGSRWLLHQFPIGNSLEKNIPCDGTTPQSGYKDNRVEYLFQYESPASTTIRDQHLANFANAGVVAMLFGDSDDGLVPSLDIWKDNQPFLKTHVAAVNNSGGFTIASANAVACGGDGGTTSASSSGSSGGGSTSSGGASSGGTGSSGGSGGGVGSSGTASGGGGASTSGSGGAASGGSGGGGSGGAPGGSSGGASSGGGGSGGAGADGGNGFETAGHSGCGCMAAGITAKRGAFAGLLLVPFALLLGRRRRR